MTNCDVLYPYFQKRIEENHRISKSEQQISLLALFIYFCRKSLEVGNEWWIKRAVSKDKNLIQELGKLKC